MHWKKIHLTLVKLFSLYWGVLEGMYRKCWTILLLVAVLLVNFVLSVPCDIAHAKGVSMCLYIYLLELCLLTLDASLD